METDFQCSRSRSVAARGVETIQRRGGVASSRSTGRNICLGSDTANVNRNLPRFKLRLPQDESCNLNELTRRCQSVDWNLLANVGALPFLAVAVALVLNAKGTSDRKVAGPGTV
eukprot:2953974-Rhodomonas_salina.3